jgi:DNA-binding response OmpR family regulator
VNVLDFYQMDNAVIKHKMVLIIEDETVLLKALNEKCINEGFDVLKAKNGIDGLSSALKNHPNLILLDLLIPGMSGMEVLKKLREDDWGKSVPVIILTNLDADDQIMQGVIRDRPTYYFVKSNTKIEDVVTKIKEILK